MKFGLDSNLYSGLETGNKFLVFEIGFGFSLRESFFS
jgi:hypothetical protein